MTILKNVEIWFARLDPKRPDNRLDKANPVWGLQGRTTDLAQKKEWESYQLRPKLIVGKEGTEEEGMPILRDGKKEWRINLKKRTITKKGEKASPIEVFNGAMEPLDPRTIGNGSIGNIRIFQYKYEKADGSEGLAPVLMGVQITKYVKYTPKPFVGDAFEPTETEVIEPEEADEEDATPTSSKSTPKLTKNKKDDGEDPEDDDGDY